jgi:acyl-CoA oxidase
VRKTALVMARLMVDNEDHGLRWFIVPICDENQMFPGVVSRRLPTRSGADPLDFSLTTFNHVFLPQTALLGSSSKPPESPQISWWNEVQRLSIGSMAVAAPALQSLKHITYIGGKYSFYRTVVGRTSKPIPIITFPTQQWPILYGVALSFVLEAWYKEVTSLINETRLDRQVQHGLAIAVKTVVGRSFLSSAEAIAERCGAQGLFENNFLSRILVSI